LPTRAKENAPVGSKSKLAAMAEASKHACESVRMWIGKKEPVYSAKLTLQKDSDL
jgi:hypothetical protein